MRTFCVVHWKGTSQASVSAKFFTVIKPQVWDLYSYLKALSETQELLALNSMITAEWRIGSNLSGSDHGIIEVPPRKLTEGTKENY
jgi:hypothetical protein